MSNRLEEMKTFFKRVIPKDKQKCVATTIIIQLKLSCYLKIVCDLLKWWRLKYYTFKNSYMFETKLSLKSSGIEKFIYGNFFPHLRLNWFDILLFCDDFEIWSMNLSKADNMNWNRPITNAIYHIDICHMNFIYRMEKIRKLSRCEAIIYSINCVFICKMLKCTEHGIHIWVNWHHSPCLLCIHLVHLCVIDTSITLDIRKLVLILHLNRRKMECEIS